MPRRPSSIELRLSGLPSDFPPTEDEDGATKRTFVHYLPLLLIVTLILSPHPSLLFVLVDFQLLTLHKPVVFCVHLFITYTLTFLAFSSLIVCVVRDPGPIKLEEHETNEEVGLTEALMHAEDDYSAPGKWCRKCWAPKPERAHHCSHCGRCILKMDHHCPWMASKCIGYRTYPAFVHFLGSITLLALYVTIISMSVVWYAFNNPLSVNEATPVHGLFLVFAGAAFFFVIGSFFGYHIYLISTNQTTLENISQFLLLRHLPPLPSTTPRLSDPPMEQELSFEQRRLVKYAHGDILLYDVGWRKNWAQVFGWNKKWGWVYRLLCGGGSNGDGKTFPRNPRSDEMLAQLAAELWHMTNCVIYTTYRYRAILRERRRELIRDARNVSNVFPL